MQKIMMHPNSISSLKQRQAAGDIDLSNNAAFSFLNQPNMSSNADFNLDQPNLDSMA
jgi:hypothetical protein